MVRNGLIITTGEMGLILATHLLTPGHRDSRIPEVEASFFSWNITLLAKLAARRMQCLESENDWKEP